MTAICSARIGNRVALIGDILLSREEDERYTPPSIPTHTDIGQIFIPGSGWIVSGVRQKLQYINNTLIMAWSGDYIHSRALATLLRDQIGNSSLSPEEIRNIIRVSGDHIDLTRITAIFHCVHECNLSVFVIGSAHGFAQDPVTQEEVIFAGTGGDIIKDHLLHIKKQTENDYIIQKVLLYGQLYLRDLIYPLESFTRYSGGSYEIALFDGARFQKSEGATFLFWVCDVATDSKSATLQLRKIIKNQYVNEYLLIRDATLSLSWEENQCSINMEDQTLHMVSPLTPQYDAPHLNSSIAPDFSTGPQCNYFPIFKDGKPLVEKAFYDGPDAKKIVEFENVDADRFNLIIDCSRLQNLLDDVLTKSR